MKFYKIHQDSIHEAFSNRGFEKSEFSFIKRRGRIITKKENTNRSFSYFLKKEMNIDVDSGQFVQLKFFEVKIDNSPILIVDSWEEVMVKFDHWLEQLV